MEEDRLLMLANESVYDKITLTSVPRVVKTPSTKNTINTENLE